MAHQSQLEKLKYRNWVKGGLSLKYLKDGLEKFADDVVRQDHARILRQIRHTTGLICTACTLSALKPLHKYALDSTTNRKCCPRGQNNCNCLYPNKSSCPNKICDAIYEEILDCHASSPPAPCLKNTDITKWVTHPWEVAKCFINAPGYKDKQTAEEIDVAGLLHVFINNTMYQTSLSCLISGNKSDAFCKALDLRNKICHSPNMELEDHDLNECLRNVVSILEDEKKFKDTQCAKDAVDRIKQLQNQEFIITTETEAIVLRDLVDQKINKLDVSNADLAKKQLEFEEKQLQLEKGHSGLARRHLQLENRTLELEEKHLNLTKERSDLEREHSELAQGHLKLEKGHLGLEKGLSVLEKKHSDLSKEISELKETHPKLEKEHLEIDQRLDNVEKDVENLKNLRQKKLISLEKRLVAQRKLANHLQRHCVKTSVSPLKTRENEIDIDKVYVEPQIETEKKYEQNEKRSVSLKSYRSIFQSDGHRMRRIYVLGEVGSGKSAFCKMMILNWCKSVNNDQTNNAKEEIENVEIMKQFDFLFYLPLRRLQKGGRIREMILWYYKDEIPEEILNDILLNAPEKCLILADGLNEWTPNYDEQRPQHVTDSLPYSEDIKEVTLLTTSRPSAPGVLNMSFAEFDLKLTMRGISAQYIYLMTEKYISLSKESNIDTVLAKLRAQKIDHIEKTPLLLQQLIWMLAHDINVGNCLSDIYSSLVNIALKWTEEKDSQKKLKTSSSCHNFTELHLPSKLMQYDACWSNRNVLFILGKIAYDLLINADSQIAFGRAKLNRDGLDDDVIDMILTIGLLTEDNCQDNTKQNTQFAFTHTSFQEYFAALYIASHNRKKETQIPDNTKQIRRKSIFESVSSLFPFIVANRTNVEQMPSADAERQPQNEDILEPLFRRCSSVQDILQFGVVLQMLCGLNPDILPEVCERIYQTAQHDIKYSMLRDQYLMKSESPYFNEYVTTTINMQKLIKSSILESDWKGETSLYKVPVLDLIISNHEDNEYTALLQCVIPQKMLHLSVILFGCFTSFVRNASDLYQNYIVEFHNLQTIAIELYRRDLPITFMTALSQHISETSSIRKIQFITIMDIDWLPVINLRGHHQLQLINTSGGINVINVDSLDLEIIKQTGSPGQDSYHYDFFNKLSRRGDVISKLRHLELSWISPTPELAKFISHNVTLNVLRLRNCRSCFTKDGVIDLSDHNDLQVLEVIDTSNVDIKSVNTTNLNTVITSRSDVLRAVRNASKLTSLTLIQDLYNIIFTKQMNEDMCSCFLLQQIDLILVTIHDEALEMNCSMRNLKRITLSYVGMSQSTWIRFVNSLLNLNQSVTVKATFSWYVFKSLSDNENKFKSQSQYIRDNMNKFKLIESDAGTDYVLTFETVPK